MITFEVLSLFPEMFQTPLSYSLIKKACDKGLIKINMHNIRDYAMDKHSVTDDYPYGGGSGMVMKVEPIALALDDVLQNKDDNTLVVLLTPQGEPFNQDKAVEFSKYSQVVLICGHYEGVDERVREYLIDREISIGDYVLTGGELPAMILIDAVSRLVPNVLGNVNSALSDSFTTGLLEEPQYTRPREYRNWEVPDVLLSGNHKIVDEWRRKESLKRTLARRPDLLEEAKLSEADKKYLEELKRGN